MSKNITLFGQDFSNVPALNVPLQGGGTAKFADVSDTDAVASDVASGKYFYTADGTKTEGTASGGGGDFSTAEVIINMSTASGGWTPWDLSSPLPILTARNEIKESVTEFPNGTYTFNGNVIFYQNTPYEIDIYSGDEYPLTATVTGNISIIGSESDAVSVSIAGAGTISVVIDDLA